MLKKESLQQIQILESILKEGNSIINNKETKIEEKQLDANFISYLTLSAGESAEEFIKYHEEFGSPRLIVSLAKQGLLKILYFEKIKILFEQGLLNSKSNNIKEIIPHLMRILEINQLKVQEYKDKETDALISLTVGLYCDLLMPLDYIEKCNNEIKCCIRNKYYDMANDYINSILQRKISLNSKKLAIINYIKQIQDKSKSFLPYEIEYEIYSENYIGRKCDQPYYLKNEKRRRN